MYRCQFTGKLSKPGEKLEKVVVQTRHQTYTHWDYESEEEWHTQGTEIVKEVNASPTGLAMWNGWTTEQKDAFVNSLK